MIKNHQITIHEKIVQTEGNIVSDMGGEKVMLSISNGKYYNLGEIGGLIWDALASPSTLNEVVNQLMDKFNVEKMECENHVISFVEHLLDEGLVRLEK
jgi:hypothetical protein